MKCLYGKRRLLASDLDEKQPDVEYKLNSIVGYKENGTLDISSYVCHTLAGMVIFLQKNTSTWKTSFSSFSSIGTVAILSTKCLFFTSSVSPGFKDKHKSRLSRRMYQSTFY